MFLRSRTLSRVSVFCYGRKRHLLFRSIWVDQLVLADSSCTVDCCDPPSYPLVPYIERYSDRFDGLRFAAL